ncbi:MAG TPA: head GIN domain-containing protein [Longimicrobiales bacterium]|nr:head GIN domain-containing protein [Longimicrobiales bacterium]
MRTALSVMPLLAAALLGGCGDILGGDVIRGRGPVTVEDRSVGSFYGVSNATVADVEILLGPYDRVRVVAEDNLIPYIRTRVENGTLRIYTESRVQLRPTQPIRIEVDVRTLEWISSSGSGDVSAPILDARWLEVDLSGSGDVLLPRLLADTLVVEHSGSGDVYVTGDVLRQRIRMSGSGHFDAGDLLSARVDARLSGSGSATVRARDRLDAVISGSGSLRYYGTPSVSQTVTGSGRVQRMGN